MCPNILFCVYGKVVSYCIKLPERSLLASVLCGFMSKHILFFVAFSLRYFVFSLSLWTILISIPFSSWVPMRSSDTISMWNYLTFKCLHSWVFARTSFSCSQMLPGELKTHPFRNRLLINELLVWCLLPNRHSMYHRCINQQNWRMHIITQSILGCISKRNTNAIPVTESYVAIVLFLFSFGEKTAVVT